MRTAMWLLLAGLVAGAAVPARAQGTPPANDNLQITGISVKLWVQNGQGYVGTVTVATTATAAGAGSYTLALGADGKSLMRDDTFKVPEGDGSVLAYGLTFPALKPVTITATLSQAEAPKAQATQEVALEFDPLTVDVTSPFYSRCLYPTQDVRQIAGTVTINLPADQIQGATLTTKLGGPGLDLPAQQKPAAATVAFSFDTPADLAIGEYPLTFSLTKGGQTLGETSTKIRKLAKPEGSCIWVDENLNTVWNGRPFFPMMWNGGYALSTQIWQEYNQPTSDFAIKRQETGEVPEGAGPMEAERIDPETENKRVTQDVVPSQKVFDTMLKNIELTRKSTALFYWYLCDEPECRGVSPVYLKYQYDFIKEHDPYHPVMIISRDPGRYTCCADILSPHPYTNPRIDHTGKRYMDSPKTLRDATRDVLNFGHHRIPAWSTPQAFTYAFQDSESQYPTFREWNVMFWAAVANGAQGMTPFFYAPSFGSMDLRLGVPWTFETVGALQRFFTSFEKAAPVTVSAPDDGVDVWMKTVNGETLIIAVNLLDQPVHATATSPALEKLGDLYGVRESTTAKAVGGKLDLDFAPYQVHLLSDNPHLLPVNGDGATSVEKIQAMVDRANAALIKPGNLLAGKGREDIEYSCTDTYTGADYSLTDGITDMLGFKQITYYEGAPWVEMDFLTFKPTFRTAKLYTPTVGDVELWAWVQAKWEKVAEAHGHNGPVITLTLDEPVTTVKIKIVMTGPSALGGWTGWPQGGWGNGGAELYEVELYR